MKSLLYSGKISRVQFSWHDCQLITKNWISWKFSLYRVMKSLVNWADLFCRSTLSLAFSYSSLATWERSLSICESTSTSLTEVTWSTLCNMIGRWVLVGAAWVTWGLVVTNVLDTRVSGSVVSCFSNWSRSLVMAPLRVILDWISRWREPVQLVIQYRIYSEST